MNRAFVFAVLIACAGSAVAAEEPEWLKTMRAREAAPAQKLVDVKSTDGWFTARVPGKLDGKIELVDDSYSVNLEIAPKIFASCEVTRDALDLGSLLNLTATATFETLAEEQGKITFRGIERTDAGHIDGSAYLAIDWIYRVETDKGPMVGSLKQMVTNRHGAGIYCVQNDVGYSRTFDALMRSLVQSLQVKEAPPPAAYEEVSVATIGKAKVGVTIATVTRDEDQEYRVDMSMAMIVPVTQETLRAQDTYTVQFAAADGTMINALHVVANDGEIESDLKLDPLEEGGWQVSGQHKGKALEGTIDGTHEPTTFIQQALVRKAMLSQANPTGSENVEWQWIAADPLRLTESRLKVTGAAGDGLYLAKETLAGLVVDTTLEGATGMMQRADFAVGANSMVIERVYTRGQL